MGRTFYLCKLVWGALAAGVLARAASRFYFTNVDPEGNIAFLAETLLLMLVLTFPLGLAAAALLTVALLLIGFAIESAVGSLSPPLVVVHLFTFGLLLAVWGILFAAGYYQWFVWLPRRLRRERG